MVIVFLLENSTYLRESDLPDQSLRALLCATAIELARSRTREIIELIDSLIAESGC